MSVCASGHENNDQAAFCSTCGAPLGPPLVDASPPVFDGPAVGDHSRSTAAVLPPPYLPPASRPPAATTPGSPDWVTDKRVWIAAGAGFVLLFIIGSAIAVATSGSDNRGDELADEVEHLYESTHEDFTFDNWRVTCEDFDSIEEGTVVDCDVTVFITTRGDDYTFNQRVKFVDDDGHFEVPRIDDQDEVLDGSLDARTATLPCFVCRLHLEPATNPAESSRPLATLYEEEDSR